MRNVISDSAIFILEETLLGVDGNVVRTDAEALALWNAWRRGRHWYSVLLVARRKGWRAWRELTAHWWRMGLNAELPASVEEMLQETQAMKREWEKRLAVPRAYVTYAALKSANEAAMRAALSATVIPDILGYQEGLFDEAKGENDG